jgi:hypothetical protein
MKPTQEHWAMDSFRHILGDDWHLVTFSTVDLSRGGTYMADGFSEEFVAAHEQEFDYVFVPDCSGPWYEAQMQGDSHEKAERLAQMLLLVSRVLKPGGTLCAAKFINEPQEVATYVADILNDHNLLSEVHRMPHFDSQFGPKYAFGVISIKM